MTSSIDFNLNHLNDPRVHEQLLFLEKLKQNNQIYEVESFVESREFTTILKQFKREKKKADDTKQWEEYLKKKQVPINTKESETQVFLPVSENKIKTKESEIQVFLPIPGNTTQGHDNSTSPGTSLNQNETSYDSRKEFATNWLNESHFFNKNVVNDNQHQAYSDLNESSGISFFNEYPNGHKMVCIDEECYVTDHICQSPPTVADMNNHHNNSPNRENLDNGSNLDEQTSCDNGTIRGSNNTNLKLLGSNKKSVISSDLTTESKSTAVTGSIARDIKTDSKEVTEIQKKKLHSSASSNTNVCTIITKNKDDQIKEENSANTRNHHEPEESYFKNVAKKIQDIPGVDHELRKVEDIRIKMTPILANIKIVIAKNLNSTLSPDEDLERIKQRTLEFGARFKRNYLYRTNCQLNKLKEMLPSSLSVSKKSKILLVIQKLSAVHHAVIQALQVIEKQLQTISIMGKTQEIMCSFYNCIYELTLTLKPFYGYLKTQILDEVEKHLVDTIKLLSDLKVNEKFSFPSKTPKNKKKQLKSSTEPPPWMKKSAALARLKFGPPIRVRKKKCNQENNFKVPEPKQSKDSIISEKGEILDHGQELISSKYFMMSVKQRPGAELRKANFDPVKIEEPKTMIEIISKEGSGVGNVSKGLPKHTTVPLSVTKQPSRSDIISVEKEKQPRPQDLKTEPKNVKLICIKRDDLINTKMEKDQLSNKDENHWDNLLKYKHAFKKYKKSNPLYERNTINTVISMSETFLEETITAVSKEINTMKIADLLGIVDEIEAYEVDSST